MLNNKTIEKAFTGLLKPQGTTTGRTREVARIENRDPSICPVCGDKLNMLQCTSHWAYVCYKDNHAAPVPNADIPQNNLLVSASRETD
jgi:hypothetical protein